MNDLLIGYTRGSGIKGTIESDSDKKIAEKIHRGQWCIFEGELGQDLAKIICLRGNGCRSEGLRVLGRFIRTLNDEDLYKVKRIKNYEEEAERICQELIEKHGLEMKIIRTTISFDERRLTFYFVAEERVDFRSLVKDLVARFHKMIRLQQIGPRDHARMVSGIGICGKELCCARFLNEVGKITKDVAGVQGMEGLSSDKISGVCGKLMCCLRYELEEYEKENNANKKT